MPTDRAIRAALITAAVAFAGGCEGSPPSPAPGASAPVPPPPPAASAAARPGSGPEPCGALNCTLFDGPEQAFRVALERRPLVLAVGETHAQKGSEAVRSTTSRFTGELLPLLGGKASDLIIELWIADPKCNKKKVAAVAEQQKEVTRDQAEGNQNEFVALGNKAKELGIQPHVLRPSCDQYDEIVSAGVDGIPKMLAMIKALTEAKAKELLDRNRAAGADKIVITYGGAMHNDLAPKPGREEWSFGRELAAAAGGRYVEIDLIVPQFIKDNASWRGLPWFEHFEKGKNPTRATLFNPGDNAYALVFAASP